MPRKLTAMEIMRIGKKAREMERNGATVEERKQMARQMRSEILANDVVTGEGVTNVSN